MILDSFCTSSIDGTYKYQFRTDDDYIMKTI